MSDRPFNLSVKALIVGDTPQILLLRRSAQSHNNPGRWDLPGGKCELGEPIDVALVREVAEETGLQVRPERVVGSAQMDLDDRVIVYLFIEAQTIGGALKLSAEHDGCDWRSTHKLADVTFPEPFCEFMRAYPEIASRTRRQRAFEKTWYEDQINEYRIMHPVYERLAEHLTGELLKIGQSLGLHSIVQARAKTIASFAEKIMRPGRAYPDPLCDLTDLCGARIICHTLGAVKAVCCSIEETFDISREDSGDKSANLAVSAFGYLSRHFIVRIKPDDVELADLAIDRFPRELKAEIQVRTVLQHAWADINHELSYKNRFKLPTEWQRQFARLAAVLEDADKSFEAIHVGLAEYASSYNAYYTEAQLAVEMEKLEVVRKAEPQASTAHQLARMAILNGNWKRAVEVLEPFESQGPSAVLRDL